MNWSKLIAFRHKRPVAFRVGLSLIVGLLLESIALFSPFPALEATRQTADEIADSIMLKAAGYQSQTLASPRFAFIDIDEKTWMGWDAPLVTPRDKLASLLDHVVRSKPSVIVVDIDLAFPDEKNEGALQDVLAAYHQAEDAPRLILVRSLKPTGRQIPSTVRDTGNLKLEGIPDIYWALPSFERDEDGTVRRWQLATVACVDDAPVIIPSVQLLAAWFFLGRTSDDLNSALAPLRSSNCDTPVSTAKVTLGMADKLSLNGALPKSGQDRNIEINTSDPSSRIMYTIPWKPNEIALGGRVGDSYKVVVRSARAVLNLGKDEPIPGIEGRIALIGGSFPESGDWYSTPLGHMPGALILINSIDALIQHGTLKEPGPLTQLGLGLLFIALVSLCVGWFRAPIAAALGVVAIGGVAFATVPLFRSGVMFSSAIPALGILLADMLLVMMEDIETIGRIGWRWIFRSVPPPDTHEEPK